MLGMVSNYSPEKHTIIGGEIGAYVKRLSEESGRDLAVICYEELAVFCVVEFLSPLRDIFIDMMNLGKSLANFDRTKATELGFRLFKPVSCDETSQFIATKESDYHHDRQNDNEEEHERFEKIERGE